MRAGARGAYLFAEARGGRRAARPPRRGRGRAAAADAAAPGPDELAPGTAAFAALAAAALAAAEDQQALAFGEVPERMAARLAAGERAVLAYEDDALLARARARARARVRARAADIAKRPEMAESGLVGARDAELKSLMTWFKQEFFVWVNKPPCEACGVMADRRRA